MTHRKFRLIGEEKNLLPLSRIGTRFFGFLPDPNDYTEYTLREQMLKLTCNKIFTIKVVIFVSKFLPSNS
jgi:hypothetical protein